MIAVRVYRRIPAIRTYPIISLKNSGAKIDPNGRCYIHPLSITFTLLTIGGSALIERRLAFSLDLGNDFADDDCLRLGQANGRQTK